MANLERAKGASTVPMLIYSRLDDNYHLSDKTALFRNMSNYYRAQGIDPFEVALPLTFNVKEASNSDEEFVKFLQAYKAFERRHESNIWILKPGEDANRGQGIQVTTSLPEVCEIINAAKALKGPSPTKPNDWLELLRRKSDYN